MQWLEFGPDINKSIYYLLKGKGHLSHWLGMAAVIQWATGIYDCICPFLLHLSGYKHVMSFSFISSVDYQLYNQSIIANHVLTVC